jgi:hypothetical protein
MNTDSPSHAYLTATSTLRAFPHSHQLPFEFWLSFLLQDLSLSLSHRVFGFHILPTQRTCVFHVTAIISQEQTEQLIFVMEMKSAHWEVGSEMLNNIWTKLSVTQLTFFFASRRELPLRDQLSRLEQAISLRYEAPLVLLSRGEYNGPEGRTFMSLNRYIDCRTRRLIFKT